MPLCIVGSVRTSTAEVGRSRETHNYYLEKEIIALRLERTFLLQSCWDQRVVFRLGSILSGSAHA